MARPQGFYFQHSNDVDALAEKLAGAIAVLQRHMPLRPVQITVPHSGVGVWLMQHLAAHQGVCANLQFIQPTQLIWQLAADAFGVQTVTPARDLDAGAILMGLLRILGEDLTALAEVQAYLRSAGEDAQAIDKRRLGLAQELSSLLQDYLTFRPHWIDAWSRGKSVAELSGNSDADWQGELWRRLWLHKCKDPAVPNPGRLLLDLPQQLRKQGAQSGHRGEPILLFGIGQLPADFVHALAAAAETRALHLFMPNPCRAYWEDVQGERSRLKQSIRERGACEPDDQVGDLIPNDLLASLGRQGQEFLGLIHGEMNDQLQEREQAAYRDDFDCRRRLGWIQQSLLQLDNPTTKPRCGDQDPSIQIHACHSRLREVEVLHDHILAWLDRDGEYRKEGFKPRDILVLAPDIDAYAPYIRAVFDADGADRPRLPFNLSDRKDIDAQPLVQGFLDLMGLPVCDFSAETIVSLLETPAIARRFDLDATDLARIRHWTAETQVHWGLDAAQRQRLGAATGSDANTWRHGLDRLLLGFAINQEETLWTAKGIAILPFPQIEGGLGEAAGKLALWLGQLAELCQAMTATARTAGGWQRFIQLRVIDALLRISTDDVDENNALESIRGTLDALRTAADRAACTELRLSWVQIRELITQALTASLARRAFLSRGISFTNTVPLRSVPARIICLLGMDSGAFPRLRHAPSFDLIQRHPKRGDRSTRMEDRYLMLETLMAARDILYLSYQGRDQTLNKPLEPSPLVREIEDLLARAGGPVETVVHPLQPFSRQAFMPDHPQLHSFHREWLPAARQLDSAGPAQDPRTRFCTPGDTLPPLPEPETWPESIRLEQLQRFLRAPAEYFFKQELNLWLERPDLHLPSDFATDALTTYAIKRYAAQQGIDHAGTLPQYLPDGLERAKAWLPPGRTGTLLVEKHYPTALAQAVAKLRETSGLPENVSIDLRLEIPCEDGASRSIRLFGSVDDVYPDVGRIIRWAPSSFHGGRCAQLLVPWLAINAQADDSYILQFMGQQGKKAEPHQLKTEEAQNGNDAAKAWLARLVRLYLRGKVAPIPFFPESAWKYLLAKDPEAAASEATRQFFHSSKFKSSEQEKNDYFSLMTRHWTESDLCGGAFREASEQVFGNPAQYYEK